MYYRFAELNCVLASETPERLRISMELITSTFVVYSAVVVHACWTCMISSGVGLWGCCGEFCEAMITRRSLASMSVCDGSVLDWYQGA